MASSPDQEMMQRLRQIKKEYSKKKRKLKKAHRASEAKAYVRQRLKEEAQEERFCGFKQEHSKVPSIPAGSENALAQISCEEMHRKSDTNPVSNPDRDNNVLSTAEDTAENKGSNGVFVSCTTCVKANDNPTSLKQVRGDKSVSVDLNTELSTGTELLKENIEPEDMFDSPIKRSCTNTIYVKKMKEKEQAVCMNGNKGSQKDVHITNDQLLKASDKYSTSRLSTTKYRKKHFVTCTPPISARSKTFLTNTKDLAPCFDKSNLTSKFQEAQVIVFERQIKSKQKPCSNTDVREVLSIGEQCSSVSGTGFLLSEIRGLSQQTVRSVVKNGSQRNSPLNGSKTIGKNITNPNEVSTEPISSSALATHPHQCAPGTIGNENKSTNNEMCDSTMEFSSELTNDPQTQQKSYKGDIPIEFIADSLSDSQKENEFSDKSEEKHSQCRKRRFSGLETQRRSRRISGQSLQDIYAQRQHTKVPKMKSKKQVILSSLFQCLVDEAARKNGEIEDFSIPDEYIDSCFKMNAICDEVHLMCEKNDNSDAKKAVKDNLYELGETGELKNTKNVIKENSENDTKNVMREISAELLTEFSESLEIEINANQSTERLNEDLDVSDLAEIRAGDNCASMNHSKSENIESPTLFESQASYETKFSYPVKDKGSNYRDIIDTELEKELEKNFEDSNDTGSSALKNGNQLSSDWLSNSVIKTDNKNGQALVNIGNILLPSADVVKSVLCVEVTSQPSMLVVCLTQSSLQVYGQLDNSWNVMATHPCKIYLKRKSAQVLYSLPKSDKLQIIVMENQSSWLTVSLFTLKETSLHKQVLTSLEGTSCLVCPITEHQIVVGSNSSMGTRVSRLDRQDSALTWGTTPLESIHHRVAALVCVRDLPDAVLGMTSDALVVIWNVRHSLIISTVDISDVCPSDALVPGAFYEQGFIMLPMLSGRRGRQAGSVVVINPQLGTSEILFAIQPQETTWAGCQISAGLLAEDLLIVKETNGMLGIWDLHSGSCIATMDGVTVSCLSSSKDNLAVAHRSCVHLFKLM